MSTVQSPDGLPLALEVLGRIEALLPPQEDS